jgi:hypothetical protein
MFSSGARSRHDQGVDVLLDGDQACWLVLIPLASQIQGLDRTPWFESNE